MNEITIKTYPEGSEKFRQPIAPTVLVVLDAKTDGDEWAVYYDAASKGKEIIKTMGYKMPENMAKLLFPFISGPYRK